MEIVHFKCFQCSNDYLSVSLVSVESGSLKYRRPQRFQAWVEPYENTPIHLSWIFLKWRLFSFLADYNTYIINMNSLFRTWYVLSKLSYINRVIRDVFPTVTSNRTINARSSWKYYEAQSQWEILKFAGNADGVFK